MAGATNEERDELIVQPLKDTSSYRFGKGYTLSCVLHSPLCRTFRKQWRLVMEH